MRFHNSLAKPAHCCARSWPNSSSGRSSPCESWVGGPRLPDAVVLRALGQFAVVAQEPVGLDHPVDAELGKVPLDSLVEGLVRLLIGLEPAPLPVDEVAPAVTVLVLPLLHHSLVSVDRGAVLGVQPVPVLDNPVG